MTKNTQISALIVTALGTALLSQSVLAGEVHHHTMKLAGNDSSYSHVLHKPLQDTSGAQIYLAGMSYGDHHSHKADSAQGDIVDTAIAAGSFNTLVTAIKAAGLVETLKSEGPFTVFAPTDAAFAKLPKGQLESLLRNKTALTKVLTYHVVAGQVKAADVVKLSSAATVEGQSLTIQAGDSVKVDNATVIKTDIATSNGVIHVIDTVMLPADMM